MSQPATESGSQKLELFLQALDMENERDRAAFLDNACGSDAPLRAGIDALLRHHHEDSFLEQPAVAVGPGCAFAAAPLSEKPGDRIGRYQLLEKIGEGGCGVVYMAGQEEPVRRRVALKIIKPGMDSREVIARFEAERQALAMMNHPNIAKIHDGGVTGTGRPYFVMELVRGVRITDYCQEYALSTRDRLDLFLQVCSAVQHAHQKGIIHRDLKPSNILVSGGGLEPPVDRDAGSQLPPPPTEGGCLRHVKVIDFGIARATDQKLTDKTFFTQFSQFVGTPAYMSPEQAGLAGADIDTRSDIYSLGVLLYELLTGTTPFDAKDLLQAGFDEMRRIIRETEPPKPSTRLTQTEVRGRRSAVRGGQAEIGDRKSEVGGQRSEVGNRGSVTGGRQSETEKPKSKIESDLDWIVMKCLEKDRGRRYETATGLAQDIQRHLDNETVSARPPNAAYRLRKMVRRNKVAFAASGALLSALIIGLGFATWMFARERDALGKERQARERAVAAEHEQSRLRQAAEAAETAQREERTKAEAEAARSDQIAKFLQEMLNGVGPSVALGRDTALLGEILDRTAERVGDELKDQPELEAALRETLGRVYFALGDYAKSEAMHRIALESLRSVHPGDRPEVAISLSDLGNALRAAFKLDEAEPVFREALAMQKRLLGDEHAEVATTLNNLALVLYDQNKLPEAETMFREALALHRKLRGDRHNNTSATLNNLALVLEDLGKLADAEAVHREGLAVARKLYPGDHPEVATGLRNLASALDAQGKQDEAVTTYREALAMMRRVHPDGHPHRSAVLNALGLLLSRLGLHDEAEKLVREALDWARERRSQSLPVTLGHLGLILERQEKFAAAETTFREALETGRTLKSRPSYLASWSMRLAFALEKQGKPADAEPLRRQVLEFARAQPRPDPQKVAQRVLDLEENLHLQGKYADAESLLLHGDNTLQIDPTVDEKSKREFLKRLVRLFDAWKQPEKAAEWRQKLDAIDAENSKPAGNPNAESPAHYNNP